MSQRARGSVRALVGAAASAAVVVAGAGAGTSPAASAPVAGDCATPYPVTELTAGQAVTGLTVSRGTTPEPFTGEVLGVLDDLIAPDLDLVMVRLTSTEIDRVGGIWAGMSGSPVYAADGRLIGAVAYGLTWGASPVAGVTPFEDMDDYLSTPAPPARVKVDAATARLIAAKTEVTAAQADNGFTRLPMPVGISGVTQSRLDQATGKPYLLKDAHVMGAAAAPGEGPGVETIVAGGNLGAAISYGDVTLGGVGTVTSVCNDQVVGFGHPFAFAGRTSLYLHPADAIYVQEDSAGTPFKLANLAAPVGTVLEDRLASITGTLAGLPASSSVVSRVDYGSRSRTLDSAVAVSRYVDTVTFYELVGNHDRTIDGIVPGSELQTWHITGRKSGGGAFSLDRTDRYTSEYDIAFESPWDVVEQVSRLSAFPGVTVDGVSVSGAVSDDTSTWRVQRVEQRRAGRWVVLSRRNPIVGTAGGQVHLRAVLSDGATTRRVPFALAIPARARGAEGQLRVSGGDSVWSEWDESSVDAFVADQEKAIRNDAVEVVLTIWGRRSEIETTKKLPPQGKVVRGSRAIPVVVS